tara:strand:- start:2741 stop:3283 length:543 start_codon:yes stop_codon:yes gene_type:complete
LQIIGIKIILKMKIEDINDMSSDLFINNFKNIFEKTTFIAIMLEKIRPFADKKHIIESFMNEFDNLNLDKKKDIIKNHPDLGNKFKVNNLLTEMSKTEQKNAGLDNCNDEEYLLFSKMNQEFKSKFKIPFIYAVKGSNKSLIMNEFKKRLKKNNIKYQLDESIKQVKKIAFFRLEEIINE